ncbi:DUF397 domain-containing protein [Streptomyces albireticuli]|uniref:DUF397 domain-containing protein n=1 Tax=Streptomyces albireticuli TaxID=1940 RepID=UPI000B43B4DE|nr:DUF397 domain-containing protein [Streptomyces albireticuli]
MNGAGWHGPSAAPGPASPPDPAPDDPPDGALIWQRSSFSGSGGGSECLEAAAARDGHLHLRESDRPTTVLTPSPGAWSAFLRVVRTRARAPRRRYRR